MATYGRGIWQIPLLQATSPASAAITLNPDPVDFGTQQVGAAGKSVTITATNSGNASLHVSSVVTSGDFVATDNCTGMVVAPGASCTVHVVFSPSATGQRIGLLTLYGDVAGGQVTDSLTGVGAAPATIVLTPPSLVFPAISVGSSSAAQNVSIANTGGTTAQLQGFAISGPFRIAANTCAAALAAQTSCTAGIVFVPLLAGASSGTLAVTDSAGVQVATLSGSANTSATDGLSTVALTFSAQGLGSISVAQQVILSNAGDVALTLIAAQVVSGDFTVSNGCGNSLNAHSSCALLVEFAPTRVGTQTGVLQVADQFRVQTVALSGTGVAPPGISLSPTNGLAWGAVGVGLTGAPQALTLTNNGGLPLAISTVTATGEFALVAGGNSCGSFVAPSAVCTIAVAFVPSVTGPLSGTLTVRDNAANSMQTIALSGTGIDFTLQQDGPTSITIASGGTARYSLLLNSASGVSGNASLTCAGVPANASCSIDPAVLPLGGGNTLVTVSVATGLRTAGNVLPPLPWSVPPVAWAVLALPLPWALRRRRKLPMHLLGLALIFCALTGCGVSRTVPSDGTQTPVAPIVTPAGTYTLNVAASSAGLVRAVSLTLTVQ